MDDAKKIKFHVFPDFLEAGRRLQESMAKLGEPLRCEFPPDFLEAVHRRQESLAKLGKVSRDLFPPGGYSFFGKTKFELTLEEETILPKVKESIPIISTVL